MEVDKLDLSLDDIIKLNKKIKKQQQYQNVRGRGRGRGQQRGGRAVGRGRGNSSSRGGIVITNQSFKRQRRGRGTAGTRRRGGVTLSLRGRNRYSQPNIKGNSPFKTQNVQPGGSQQTRGRGQGRGRGIRGRSRVRGQGQLRSQGQVPEIGLTKGLTSLNRRREQAVKSLMKAKETLARLNARQKEQRQSRALGVNQRRGLQVSTTSLNKVGRGRGRGRGGRGRGGLSRYSSNMSLASIGSQVQRGGRGRGRGQGQQGLNRAFSGSMVSVNSVGSQGNRQRRRWRQPKATTDSSLLTISVQNSPPPLPRKRNKLPRYNVGTIPDSNPELQAQIRNLKPAVSTKYNFKKSVFAQATSTSLSDRFSANLPTSPGGTQTDLQGRKVFF